MIDAVLVDRRLFPSLGDSVYLAHCAISPPSLPVQEAVAAVLEDYARSGLAAWGRWQERRQSLRAKLAELIRARPTDLALVPNTTFGVQAVSLCRAWRPGQRVLTFHGEFPTNVTPWQSGAKTFGTRVDLLPLEPFERGEDEGIAALEEELQRGEVALVAVSLVQFQTGLRMPVEAMARCCHRYGAELFVDAIQGVGVVPFAVGDIDYVAVGSHKWLMGLEGAGFLYVNPARIDEWEPRVAGWLSHEDPVRFLFEGSGHLRYDRPIRRRVDFLEAGAANVVGFAALEAAVDLLQRLGIDRIHAHVQAIHDQLAKELSARGFRSARTASLSGRSGILAVKPPGTQGAPAWARAAGQRGVMLSAPDGWLRFAPHWPNGPEQCTQVLAVLDEISIELRNTP